MQNVLPEFPSVQRLERKQKNRDSRIDFPVHAEVPVSGLKIGYSNRNVDTQRQWQSTRIRAVRNDDLRSPHPQATFLQFSESNEGGIQSEIFANLATQRKKVDWLEEAINELAACPELAVNENMDKPSRLALEKTKVLLETISKFVEDQPDIYPMDECSIAIDFRNPDQMSGILFLVEKDGSGAYFSRTRKSKARTHVTDAADLLDEGGLKEFERLGIL